MANKIINGCKYWGQLFLLPVYWLSFLFPRNKNIWLFGSTFGRRFADNPRYMYLYMSQNRQELGIRPIWISHKKDIVSFLCENGYEAYYYHSLKGIWYALRGKVYLFDNYSKDINFWQSGGAVKVNLWHGIPLKKIQADNIFDKFRHPKNAWESWKNFPRTMSDEKPHHYVLTTSEFLKPIFESAFRTKNVLINGYPRNESMLSASLENLYTVLEQGLLDEIKTRTAKEKLRMVYYMPTFRDSETKFFDVVDIKKFNEYLEESNLLFCAKLHPKSKLRKEFEKISGGNVIVIDADTDPYVFIGVSDMLITDYSSIYFDYILSGKPVLFFDYDLQEYLKDSREMYFHYEEYTPGLKAESVEALQQGILDTLDGKDVYREQREKMIEKMFKYQRRESGKEFVAQIKKLL